MQNNITSVIVKDGVVNTKVHVAEWTDQQKQNFLNTIKQIKIQHNINDECFCVFDVHYDKSVLYPAYNYSKTPKIKEMQSKISNMPVNKPNQIIINIHPDLAGQYPGITFYNCITCLKRGKCKSPFIKKHIGQILFPDKYSTNQGR